MSNYYSSSGYSNQQQQPGNGTTGGFYNAGGYGQQQPQQQRQESQQAHTNTGYNSSGGYQQPQQQQWNAQSQSAQPGTTASFPGQQQPQQQPNLWDPSTASNLMSVAGSVAAGGLNEDAMLKISQNIWKSSSARMVPGLESAMGMLRIYFAVDNRYVKRKMQKILFPFLSKNWRRLQTESTGPELQVEYALPNSDENAPDLYIPSMSSITYVLLCALCYGTAGEFNPEVLPDVLTKCLVTQIVEVLGIRFGMYVMQAPTAFLDLFSYTGYKYLGLCFNMLAGLVGGHLGHGHRAFYLTFLWTATAASFFMLKTMANNIPTVTAATGPKREVMVCAFAASQFATMWFVSQTKFLDSKIRN